MSDKKKIMKIKQFATETLKKKPLYDSKGIRLKKDGTPDMRQFLGTSNLEKSEVFQAIKRAKKESEKKIQEAVDEPDSEPELDPIFIKAESDSEPDDYVMEEVIVKNKSEPQVVEKVVEKEVEKIVEKIVEVPKEIIKADPAQERKMRILEENNRKIKEKFDQIAHINQMQFRNRQTQLKF